MDELFTGIDNRFKVSMADSTMMCILHTAMNKAHEKVRSKQGVIERLNEQSKFCELAIMQLEACLKFVEEETGSYIVDNTYDKLLSDLTEIKNRLYGRLRETENALAGKDRELAEKDKALEATEKELQGLRRNEEERREGDFCELKNSVDQQFFNIKQHLEGERMALTRRISASTILDDSEVLDNNNNSSIDDEIECDVSPSKNMGFDQMGLEIDRLKETLDSAFGIMQSAISDVGPLEMQWMRVIENDIQSISFKEFMINLQGNLVSMGVLTNTEEWSELINDVTLLHNELKYIGAKSLKAGDNSGEFVVKDEEDLEEDGSNLVARMIRNHESIIRTKSEELNWVRAVEMIQEKSRSSFTKGKDSSLENGINNVIKRLDDLLKWKAKLKYGIKLEKDQIPCIEDADDENERRLTKQEMEDSSLQFKVMEEIYNCFFKSSMKEFEIELHEHGKRNSIQRRVSEEIFQFALKDTVKNIEIRGTSKFCLTNDHDPNTVTQMCEKDNHIQSHMQEEVRLLLFNETANSWTREFEDYRLEHGIRQEVFECAFLEIMKEVHEDLINEALIKEKSSATNTERNMEVNRNESLIQELDSLLSDMNIEDLMMQSCETKEESVNFDLASLESIEDEVIFSEVSSKLEKALQQLGSTKTLLKELRYNEEMAANQNGVQKECDLWSLRGNKSQSLSLQKFANHKYLEGNSNIGSQVDPDRMTTNLVVQAKSLDAEFSTLPVFYDILVKFEGMLQQKLNLNNSRLQKLNDQVKPLLQHIAFLKKKELLYKKAFVRRCQNLHKAETEVDILGDQVDTLTDLLERIYRTLDYYSPVLQRFSGILDILIWIRNELNLRGVAHNTPKYGF